MIVAVILFVLAIALGVIGILAWTRKLPGNNIIGLRLAEVREDREIWEGAHKAAGPMWALGGLALFFGGLIALRAHGWTWILPALSVIVAVAAVGIGANLGARMAMVLKSNKDTLAQMASASSDMETITAPGDDAATQAQPNQAQPNQAPKPSVDMDALRRAMNNQQDQ